MTKVKVTGLLLCLASHFIQGTRNKTLKECHERRAQGNLTTSQGNKPKLTETSLALPLKLLLMGGNVSLLFPNVSAFQQLITAPAASYIFNIGSLSLGRFLFVTSRLSLVRF